MPKYKNPRRTWVDFEEIKHEAIELTVDPDNKVKDVAAGLGMTFP